TAAAGMTAAAAPTSAAATTGRRPRRGASQPAAFGRRAFSWAARLSRKTGGEAPAGAAFAPARDPLDCGLPWGVAARLFLESSGGRVNRLGFRHAAAMARPAIGPGETTVRAPAQARAGARPSVRRRRA